MTEKITVFTTMKNEGPYMLEWVAFHRTLGVDHFIIFTNSCEDGTDDIARRLQELGLATHVTNEVAEGGNPQHQMLRRARRQPKVKSADWLLCMDVDEFWNIRCGDGTFPALISEVEARAGRQVDAISFAWKLFGSSGNISFEDRPVTQAFTMGDNDFPYHSGRASGLKTLFRNNGRFSRFGPHRPKGMEEGKEHEIAWSDAGGNLFPAADVGWRAWRGFDHSLGRLHHYSVRSLDGFLVKRDRGRTNHIRVDQGQSYWLDMNVNKQADTSIQPMAERAAPLLAELKADPELARLHQGACDWHRAKVAEIKLRPDWVAFRSWLADNLI
ncbi:glycosyl transferase family 2 [Ruegeria marisrubri]|uniref:Glycosyl transferase family 2 n=1 Tax=Ruegeria marisrubri TaxID=1685379 RepID=A0A117KH60_9RHOB|nr:glycosyltransferase family 2 protein [Ruegeria marisrubri]KUJ85736.1 glycosyl transferase family 2 [Ruegeria marisrubri]